MPVPDIKKHATVIKGNGSYRETWKCKYCDYTSLVQYSDYSNLRRHIRNQHRVKYMGQFIINEEADHLWSLAR